MLVHVLVVVVDLSFSPAVTVLVSGQTMCVPIKSL